MRPAGVAYCEAVTKKASENGWKIRFNLQGFQWSKGGKDEIFVFTGIATAGTVIHEACKWLDDKEGWKVNEELKFDVPQTKIS